MSRVFQRLAPALVLAGAVSACAAGGPDVKLKADLTSGMSSGTAESYYYYIDGFLHELGGRLDKAGKVYSRAVERDPNSPHLLTRLASILIRQGKLNQAEKLVRKAVALDPAI